MQVLKLSGIQNIFYMQHQIKSKERDNRKILGVNPNLLNCKQKKRVLIGLKKKLGLRQDHSLSLICLFIYNILILKPIDSETKTLVCI